MIKTDFKTATEVSKVRHYTGEDSFPGNRGKLSDKPHTDSEI